MPHDNWMCYHEDQPVLTGELGPLRRYDLRGRNGLREIEFTMVVFAASASAAIKRADEWRRENNKVRAESWRTTPAF